MKLMLDVDIKQPEQPITYADKIFLIGSCFTEHIGKKLDELKFPMLQNPNGILFDPLSVCNSLNSYIEPTIYTTGDLFYLNELWQSWRHHSLFSRMKAEDVLQKINASQVHAHDRLQQATWLIITLGSSFSYQLLENGFPVANCHRAPAQWFKKTMVSSHETVAALQQTIESLQAFNPTLKIILTISPVRHSRDGVVENNRSKGRLIEAVHSLICMYAHLHYFPAYELVIDCLRDYRFYDIDLVHPNFAATEFVFEKFVQGFIDSTIHPVMEEIKKVSNAYRHRPFQPETNLHKTFLAGMYQKVLALQQTQPQLDFLQELQYFSGGV